MSRLIFERDHAMKAIRLTKKKGGLPWLYRSYPGLAGKIRRSTTGFLMHEGIAYPVKALGRLANEIAGEPMSTNPITNVFRQRFKSLGFQLIDSVEAEATAADERQKRLAQVWERPEQARFRREVFELFGAKCLVTGCETLSPWRLHILYRFLKAGATRAGTVSPYAPTSTGFSMLTRFGLTRTGLRLGCRTKVVRSTATTI